jgi:hypothetical protein
MPGSGSRRAWRSAEGLVPRSFSPSGSFSLPLWGRAGVGARGALPIRHARARRNPGAAVVRAAAPPRPDQDENVRLTPCPPAREKRACLLLYLRSRTVPPWSCTARDAMPWPQRRHSRTHLASTAPRALTQRAKTELQRSLRRCAGSTWDCPARAGKGGGALARRGTRRETDSPMAARPEGDRRLRVPLHEEIGLLVVAPSAPRDRGVQGDADAPAVSAAGAPARSTRASCRSARAHRPAHRAATACRACASPRRPAARSRSCCRT